MVNQNVQDAHNKFQNTKTKGHEMIQRQIKEPREHFNKQQSEIKDTMKKELHELKRTHKLLKELITLWKNLKRKNQTEIKSPYSQTIKLSGRPFQQTRKSERITELQDKIEIKEKKQNNS
jgi:paraquat-inducible protein B